MTSDKSRGPLPDNAVIKTLFYTYRFLRRIPFYLPLDEEYKNSVLDDVKSWTKERYIIEFEIAYRSLTADSQTVSSHNSYTSLEDWIKGPRRVVVYEWLHRIRWKRLSDVLIYHQSKYIGFHWTEFLTTRGEH